ncbi:hypothetical protein ACSS6N_09625 [Peribacillus frigoritolerans]|uniref:hypothetical protein n=1 Tax=Peribacillus frigoritolerans TaxID=450367 RepID=UPI003F84CA65
MNCFANYSKKNYLSLEGFSMWVITVFLKGNIKIFEFDTEKEAKELFKNMKGTKILSEIVYFNDPCFV